MYERETTIINKTGLHARPAAVFVQEAKKFVSKIIITNPKTGQSADAKSMLRLLTLSLVRGTNAVLSAEGADEKAAVDTLVDLIQSGLGEEKAAL